MKPPGPIVRFASPISVGNLSPMRRAAQLVLQAARQAAGSAPALSSQPAPLVALRSATGERTNHMRGAEVWELSAQVVGSFSALLPKPDVPSLCCRRRWPHTMALEPLLLLWRSQPAAAAKGAAAAAFAAVAVGGSEAADVMHRPAHCIPGTLRLQCR